MSGNVRVSVDGAPDELVQCDPAQPVTAFRAAVHAQCALPYHIDAYVVVYVDQDGGETLLADDDRALSEAGVLGVEDRIEVRLRNIDEATGRCRADGAHRLEWGDGPCKNSCQGPYEEKVLGARGGSWWFVTTGSVICKGNWRASENDDGIIQYRRCRECGACPRCQPIKPHFEVFDPYSEDTVADAAVLPETPRWRVQT